jgi:hypothetical protein
MPADDMLLRLERLVDAQAPCQASIYDEHFDYLTWNEPYALVRHDPGTLPVNRRNMLWMMFTHPANRARMVRWESAARQSQPVPRRGRPPSRRSALHRARGSPKRGKPLFRDRWPTSYPLLLARSNRRKASRGQADPARDVPLRLVDQPSMIMVVQVPASNTYLARVRSLLVHSPSC